MHVNGFDCRALCDLGASISIMPRKIYDMLDLPPLETCYFDVLLLMLLIRNLWEGLMMFLLWLTITLFPLIFLLWMLNAMLHVLLLGRPFLRTVGVIIDMKEGTIKYHFPLKKGMEHFPRKRRKLLFDSILRANYELDASSLDIT
jgi:hypothetical protein